MQQVLVVALPLRQAVGQRGQLALDGQHARRLAPRDRQRQQRQQAVGLDLDQALQRAPGLARRQAAVEHQPAREAIVVEAEVGEHRAGAFGNARAGHAVAAEMFGQRGGIGADAVGSDDVHVRGGDGRPGTADSQSAGISSAAGSAKGRATRRGR